jgi:protocatechuate 3,4-dioxygenase beta subunit
MGFRFPLSRRDLLEKCAAAGLLLVAPPFTIAERVPRLEDGPGLTPRHPTPPNDLGPFFKRNAPRVGKLAPEGAPGLPLSVSGQVFSTRGDRLPDAVVEVWHTSHAGVYDNQGFNYRGRPPLDAGKYGFESVMPGHYPDRVCQHVHYRIMAPGHKPLITQLYFATDPVFEGDPDRNFGKDPLIHTRELVRPVTIAGDPGSPRAVVTFDIVLERA